MSSVARTPAVLATSVCTEEGDGEQRKSSAGSNPHLMLCVRAHIVPIRYTTTEWNPVSGLVLALGSGTPAEIRSTPGLASNRMGGILFVHI